jgi:surface protein
VEGYDGSIKAVLEDKDHFNCSEDKIPYTDWGDGCIDNELIHYYSEPGEYIITTTNFIYDGETADNVKEVTSLRYDFIDMRDLFDSWRQLQKANLRYFNTVNVNNMRNLFCYCTSLQSLDLSRWNVSNVTSMSNMFFYCTSLTSLGNIKNWKPSKVTSIFAMFSGCESLTELNLKQNTIGSFYPYVHP